MNVLGSTKILGVFGHPVSHSLSPVMHNAAIEALNIDFIYVPFHVLPDDLGRAVDGVRALSVAGVNVTIPHKERVIEHLDEISEEALRIRSVNTIINTGGWLRGESTDGRGFLRSAEAEWGKLGGASVVVLGAGGSAKAISFALAEIGCKLVIANRTRERAEELAGSLNSLFGNGKVSAVGLDLDTLSDEIRRADLLVNTTSVGMHPDVDGIPVSTELLHPGLLVYDLVYNPAVTRLVSEARSRGAKAVTGLGMLIYQGALSLELWTGQPAPIEVMRKAIEKVIKS
ncbi:MAG: shikimate dehydrogenase [Armatimonadota bacterium]|nr:shikimate dehydrogenase [bacterium]